MEGVTFDESEAVRRVQPARPSRGLTKLIISWGLAKDEAGAQKVLFIILGVSIAATAMIWVLAGGGEIAPPPPEVFQGM